MNYTMLQNGIVNYRNANERDQFFVGMLMAHGEEIYSFSFGTADGEYYGARRNRDNVIEITRRKTAFGGCQPVV